MLIQDLFQQHDNEVVINWTLLETIPEFKALHGCMQNTIWHQEGDAFNHTRNVVDHMEVILKRENVTDPDDYMILIAAALFHDIGKPTTTYYDSKTKQYATKDHGTAGAIITRRIFFDEDIVKREELVFMVKNHMPFHYIKGNDAKNMKKLIKLSYGFVSIKYMLMLNEADSMGSESDNETIEDIQGHIHMIKKMALSLNCYDRPYTFKDSQSARESLNNIQHEDVPFDTTTTFTVHIMCGFPGAGKSTYIKNDPGLKGLQVISRDIVRCELGFAKSVDDKVLCSKQDEQKVSKVINNMIKENCKNRVSFILDNTTLRYEYRQGIMKDILKYNPEIHIIYVEAPSIETCIERRSDCIPANEYTRLVNLFAFPMPYECDKLTIAKDYGDGCESIINIVRPVYESDPSYPINSRYHTMLMYD